MSTKPVLIYNLFPRLAGTFNEWKKHIDRAAEMKFNYLYVNSFLYPGFSGSLYSIKDYYKINPLFVAKKSKKDEWTQVKDMVHYSHKKGLKFIFDLVINHTAIDSPWVKEHPEWYKKDEKGKVLKPYCMDGGKKIVWGDLAELDLEPGEQNLAIREYWSDYLRMLIDLSIFAFRCDAAYQVPVSFWEKLISDAKQKSTDVEFFAETLGCDYKDVIKLSKAGFDYSFNSSKYWDFEAPWAIKQNALNIGISKSVSFAESHDTYRLAAEYDNNMDAVKLRYLFSTLFSTGVMMPIGFEFGFNKRMDVVKSSPDDWEETGIDVSGFIQQANAYKFKYPVFAEDSPIDRISDVGEVTALLKVANSKDQSALIILNKNFHNYGEFYHSDLAKLFGSNAHIKDISLDYRMESVPNEFHYSLRPAQVIVLLQNAGD